ncbi:MAG: ABC transporter ATP-binding protein [Verrucomicrobiae bacterium]|nr:ABC transporter ATP-binding protein [Verrucomicrobiae bacterium]
MPLLEIKNLTLELATADGRVRVLDGLSLSIARGETLCLVGESGCGKSLTALSIARLVPSPPARYAGQILLEGQDVLAMSPRELRRIRGRVVSYVFQDPGAALNPVLKVGTQIMEMLKLHRPEKASETEVIRLLKLVGIPAPEQRVDNYPFQLSGGMQQRVMLAIALAAEPALLVADEPTTALDVTVQAQILELLRALKHQLGMAILLITHNLGIVGEVADRVAVMYAGQIVELGPAPAVLQNPLHPYTKALKATAPQLGATRARLEPIPGAVPSLAAPPPGCRFAPRCKIARPDCSEKVPELIETLPGHWVRCPYSAP